jgi:hypothetical protein
MTPVELTKQWLRLPDIGHGDRRRLCDAGVTEDSILRAGGMAITRVEVRRQLWHPQPAGRPMLINSLWNGPAPSIFQAVEHPLVMDLLAWTPAEPDAIYRRTGAGTVLGEEYVAHGLAGEPIRLFATILDWLRAGCTGIVPLDYVVGGHAPDLEEAA